MEPRLLLVHRTSSVFPWLWFYFKDCDRNPEGVLNEVLYKEASPPRSNPLLTLLQKRYPFLIHYIRYHFQKPNFELYIPSKLQMPCLSDMLAIWGILQTEMTDFPSYTSTSEIPTLSYTRSLKKVSLSLRAPT